MNALLHQITQLISIKQVFTSGFCPYLNGAKERSRQFLNSALGIFCEHQQEKWEQFLQPAVYSHNVSPISGTTNITPFFLVFGRDAPSPETISFDLPVHPLPQTTTPNICFPECKLPIKDLVRSSLTFVIIRRTFMIVKLLFRNSIR